MGVISQSFNFINRFLDGNQKSICELGDQQFYQCPPFQEGSFTKKFWENKGFIHTYIDIHGKNGVLLMNLSEEQEIEETYDIITDFGTLEHIEDFYMGFKNVHNLCKNGGIMIHVLPSFGHWPNHGTWRGKINFFIGLPKLSNYIILSLFEEKTSFGGIDSNQVYVAYQKNSGDPFISREEFESLNPIKVGDEKYEEGIGRIR
jgi:hypothetical protein